MTYGSFRRTVSAETANASTGRKARNGDGYRAVCPFCGTVVTVRGRLPALSVVNSCGHYVDGCANGSGVSFQFENYA